MDELNEMEAFRLRFNKPLELGMDVFISPQRSKIQRFEEEKSLIVTKMEIVKGRHVEVTLSNFKEDGVDHVLSSEIFTPLDLIPEINRKT